MYCKTSNVLPCQCARILWTVASGADVTFYAKATNLHINGPLPWDKTRVARI